MGNSQKITSPEFKEFTGLKKGWFCLDRDLWNVIKKIYPDKTKAERMPYHYILIMMYNDAWYGDEPYLINHKVNNKSAAYYLNKGEFEFKRSYWSEVTGLTIQNLKTFEQKLIDLGMICAVKSGKGQLPIYRLCQLYSNFTGNNTTNFTGNFTTFSNDAGLRGVANNTGNNTTNNTGNFTLTNISVNKEVNKDYSNENPTVIDAASPSLAAFRPTAADNAFSEKDKGQMTSEPNGPEGLYQNQGHTSRQVPSEPQGLYSYQPQPVKAPEFHMGHQSLPNNEDNAFGITELFDRLKLYLPSGFSLDKNQQSFIRTEYFKIANPNRRQGSFRKQNGELWDLYSFTEWIAKLLREQGVQTSEKPMVNQSSQSTQLRASDVFSMKGHTGTEGGMELIRKLGGKIL